MTKGFTLIELMIVITIIGITSAIAIPAYQGYVARAQISEALILSSQYKIVISQIYSQSGNCPTPTELGLNNIINPNGKFIHSINTTTLAGTICAIEFTFKNSEVSNQIQGKHLIIAMTNYTEDLGASNWSCTSSDIAQIYLPKACTGI